jgi:hypothetical protein
MKTAFKICSYLLVLLGIVHIAMTPVFFNRFGLDVLWFAGTGMGLIFLGNLNLLVIYTQRPAFYMMSITSNIIGLLLMILILTLTTAAQAYIGVGLLLVLSVISVAQYVKIIRKLIS